MKRSIIVTMICMAGCAGPTIYDKPGTDAAQQNKDFAECRFEAAKATGSAPSGSITEDTATTLANDINTGIRQNEILQLCLQAKGYSPQTR